MTSMELAEHSGMRHDNLMQIIRRELEATDATHLDFQASYKDASGRRNLCYALPGEYLLHVLTAFDAKLRFKLIRHWQTLNDGKAKPVANAAEVFAQQFIQEARTKRQKRYVEELAAFTEGHGRLPTARERFILSLP